MKITDVRVRIVKKDDSKLKAVASITLDDCFVIHDLKVVEGKKGVYVMMPTKQLKDGIFKEVAHPLNTETRAVIQDCVLSAYFKLLKESETT